MKRMEQIAPPPTAKKTVLNVAAYARISMETERTPISSPHRSVTTKNSSPQPQAGISQEYSPTPAFQAPPPSGRNSKNY
mgnify:CR=1 FL=1